MQVLLVVVVWVLETVMLVGLSVLVVVVVVVDFCLVAQQLAVALSQKVVAEVSTTISLEVVKEEATMRCCCRLRVGWISHYRIDRVFLFSIFYWLAP
jgi:hypothetical protein